MCGHAPHSCGAVVPDCVFESRSRLVFPGVSMRQFTGHIFSGFLSSVSSPPSPVNGLVNKQSENKNDSNTVIIDNVYVCFCSLLVV